jgi:sporulation protein YlmC with PRC-barrel domain
MILSDLMRTPVMDVDGHRIGRVIDARFVIAGSPGQLLSDATLVGLIVSEHRGGSFLGYERTDTTSPWPLAQLLRRRQRRSFLVRWEDIAVVGRENITLRADYKRVDPLLSQRA